MSIMTTVPSKINWTEMINESVHTSDDQDIGDVEAISSDFIVVKRGFINVHRYYIPASKVEGWDGDVLWLKITEEEVKRNYERNIAPDPYRYYVKDYPYYAEDYPPLLIIPQRYQPPAYAPRQDVKKVYKCDICNQQFPTRDEFSSHVKAMH